MIKQPVTIINKLGLHARAAAKFVTCASRYRASIQISRNGQQVDGKSIMGVMLLAASQGTTVTIDAEGPDADDALEALEALLNDRFGEPQ